MRNYDATAWLNAQTIDYLAPQLYWAFDDPEDTNDDGQDYGLLAPWWADIASANSRHLYPGHAVYKSDANTYWDPSR